MPYPFVRMPTISEVVSRLSPLGVTEGFEPGPGTVYHYLTREVDGSRRIAILPDIGPEDRLAPSVLSSICRQLAVDADLFGFTLGWLPD